MLLDTTGMVTCPKCRSTALAPVVNSRRALLRDGSLTQMRRRSCHKCRWRWNTIEVSATDAVEVDWDGTAFSGSAK